MLRAGVLKRLRTLHHQRSASTAKVPISELSSPASTTSARYNLRIILFVLQFGLFSHFVASHIGFVAATHGPSMVPTIGAAGDWVLISKLHKRGKSVKVGDMVDFAHPLVPGMGAIKRIAAMPGDFIVWDAPAADGDLEIQEGGVIAKSKGGGVDIWAEGEEKRMLQIPEGHFWALGDNQPESRDSRTYGPLPLGLINGKVTAKIWPFGEAKWFENNLQPVSNELYKDPN